MKKRVLWLLMALLMCIPFTVANAAEKTSADFSDLKDLDAATKAKFDAMISAGIFDGVSEGSFGLKDEMNRAQFAKVAALIFNLKVDADVKTSSFKDVKADDPANGYALPYIEAVKAAGITDGYGPSTFNPAGTVTKEQLATFLVRGLGMNEDAKKTPGVNDATVSDWAKGYVALALEKKLLANGADGKFGGASNATRDLLVTGAYEAKEQYVAQEEQKKEEEEKKKEEEKKNTPPIITSPYVPPTLPTLTLALGETRTAGSKTAEVLVTPSVTGTVYSVVTAYNSATPSSEYIVQGLGADGQPALDYQQRRVSADFQDHLVVGNSWLNDDTSYDVYVVLKDDAGNMSVIKEIIITTPPPAYTPPTGVSVTNVVYDELYGDLIVFFSGVVDEEVADGFMYSLTIEGSDPNPITPPATLLDGNAEVALEVGDWFINLADDAIINVSVTGVGIAPGGGNIQRVKSAITSIH